MVVQSRFYSEKLDWHVSESTGSLAGIAIFILQFAKVLQLGYYAE